MGFSLTFTRKKKKGTKAKSLKERVKEFFFNNNNNNNNNIALFFNLLDFFRSCYDMQGCFSFTLHMSFFKVYFLNFASGHEFGVMQMF